MPTTNPIRIPQLPIEQCTGLDTTTYHLDHSHGSVVVSVVVECVHGVSVVRHCPLPLFIWRGSHYHRVAMLWGRNKPAIELVLYKFISIKLIHLPGMFQSWLLLRSKPKGSHGLRDGRTCQCSNPKHLLYGNEGFPLSFMRSLILHVRGFAIKFLSSSSPLRARLCSPFNKYAPFHHRPEQINATIMLGC